MDKGLAWLCRKLADSLDEIAKLSDALQEAELRFDEEAVRSSEIGEMLKGSTKTNANLRAQIADLSVQSKSISEEKA